MRCVLILLLAAGSIWIASPDLFAMVYVEYDGVLLYFPEDEQAIAARLNRNLPDMLTFLEQQGLPVERPLHIVVDPDLDAPEVRADVIPHLEIRIPLRAPGVLEEGYTEADPWTYFMFKGLCRQGIYGLRSGIPGVLHTGFGKIMSPNLILPPWVEGGICNLLYALYRRKDVQDPFEAALFRSTPPPDLEIISHHPQIWPGYFAYRIYGKPFVFALFQEYGWNRILEFLQVHGGGVIPIEIDLKARKVFGKTGAALWRDFQRRYPQASISSPGLLARGYWAEPFVYWNRAGVFPGKLQVRHRGRYGYAEPDGTLWLSEFSGRAGLVRYSGGRVVPEKFDHIWDPGPGRVAVTRIGSRPHLIIVPDDGQDGYRRLDSADADELTLVPAPENVLQLSGPVRNDRGRVAVAANMAGNWDIWIYDGRWHRMTRTASIELDPWWEGDSLVYASNATGRFQIHAADRKPITDVGSMALLPRQGKYLKLTSGGWRLASYKTERFSFPPPVYGPTPSPSPAPASPDLDPRPYSLFKSLWPNYVRPDLFAAVSDLQVGLATRSRDVSGDYRLNAGLRYSFDTDYFALRLGFQAHTLGTQFTRYPVSYTTDADQTVDESRHEIRLFWRPLDLESLESAGILRSADGPDRFEGLELSLNWRNWDELESEGSVPSGPPSGDETWLGIGWATQLDILRLWGSLEFFSEARQSLTLGGRLLFGEQTLTSAHLMLGRAWGDAPDLGHTTFRIGGNVSEGYFTRLPPKLFPVRGFDSNLVEAPKAAAAGIEVFWPLANLQMGYATLPLFLHRLRLGTFVDAGIAGEAFRSEDLLVGAGVELVTSLEIAWGNFSAFRMGVAWPLVYPDFIRDDGPKFVFQLGKPL
jgi:hypothetical protein